MRDVTIVLAGNSDFPNIKFYLDGVSQLLITYVAGIYYCYKTLTVTLNDFLAVESC